MAGGKGKIYDKWEKGGKSTTNVEKCTTHKRARVVREVSFEAQTAQISLSVPLATGEPPTTRMSEEIEISFHLYLYDKGGPLSKWQCQVTG